MTNLIVNKKALANRRKFLNNIISSKDIDKYALLDGEQFFKLLDYIKLNLNLNDTEYNVMLYITAFGYTYRSVSDMLDISKSKAFNIIKRIECDAFIVWPTNKKMFKPVKGYYLKRVFPCLFKKI